MTEAAVRQQTGDRLQSASSRKIKKKKIHNLSKQPKLINGYIDMIESRILIVIFMLQQ